jgi:HPt (histidine-containing phosphotransfer) domain-containing protein
MNSNEINIGRLIKASNNDEAFIRSMLVLFIDRTPGMVAEMIEACKKKDYHQTLRLAHQLKPSVDMIGNVRTSELLFNIYEKTKSESNCEKSLELIETFNRQINEMIGLINEKLQQEKLII